MYVLFGNGKVYRRHIDIHSFRLLMPRQGRRRQLKSGTAKLCLRTNFRGIQGHAPPEFCFSLYRHTRIFTLFRVIDLHIFKETS